MSDIAAATAIGPSALYRHFRGKDDLLYHVVHHELTAIRAAVANPPDDEGTLRAAVEAVLDHRHTGVLWQRESRHLAPSSRRALRDELRAIQRRFAGLLTRRRRELPAPHREIIAWASLAALMSVSFQRIALPRAEYEELLGAVARDVLDSPVRPGETGHAPPAPAPATRRDELLAAATRLFAERGYETVGVDDLGAAAGIAGPSVYNHFDSKLDLLLTILSTGNDQLQEYRSRMPADDQDALRGLVRSYAEFSFANSAGTELMITETAHLPEPHRTTVRDTQRGYVAEWTGRLRRVHPEMSPAHVRVRVQAAINVITDIARMPRLRARPTALPTVRAIGQAVLRAGE